MLRSLFSFVYAFWVRIANIGVNNDLTFHETKKTQLLNVVVASGIPMNFGFCLLNFAQGKTLLAICNLLLFGGGILILIINSYQRFLLSRLIMILLASILFSVGAVFFRNGGEYYLITNLIVILIYFKERIYVLFISLFNCLLFIGIRIFLEYSGYEYGHVPFSRVIFNIAWSLLVIVLALLFFKREQEDYLALIEQKNKELETLNANKQKLFSIIAHDLRSPIGQLKNSLELVRDEYMPQETFRQISSRLSSDVDQLHSTLDNLLEWSISQFKGVEASPERTSLSVIVERKASLFRQLLERKNLVLHSELHDLYVYVDPDHLLLVLRNLISNAIKYSFADGHIFITARQINRQVELSITDQGVGMTKEIQDALFSSGAFVSQAGTAHEKGTGLGLKLCKEFIEKNGGAIRVASKQGEGSTFFVTLPAA